MHCHRRPFTPSSLVPPLPQPAPDTGFRCPAASGDGWPRRAAPAAAAAAPPTGGGAGPAAARGVGESTGRLGALDLQATWQAACRCRFDHSPRSSPSASLPPHSASFLASFLPCLQVGLVLLEQYQGQAANLIRAAGQSAVRLVRLVTAAFSGFRDHCVYRWAALGLLPARLLCVAALNACCCCHQGYSLQVSRAAMPRAAAVVV